MWSPESAPSWPDSPSTFSGISFEEMRSYFPLLPTQEEFDNATIGPFLEESSGEQGRLPVFRAITANRNFPTQEEFDNATIDPFIWKSSLYRRRSPVFREVTAHSNLQTQDEFDNATIIRGCSRDQRRLPVFQEITANSHLPIQEELKNDILNSKIRLPSLSARRLPFPRDIAANSGYRYSVENCECRDYCRMFHSPLTTERETRGADAALKELEVEIVYLLRSRSGQPVSISALPALYLDMFGKSIRAEGYLPRSQRKRRTGMNMTALLLRFPNQIQIIYRPHGQHDVILVDYNKYAQNRNEREYRTPGSAQIFFTFTENIYLRAQNVAEYFENFGRVLKVKIPGKPRRNFGFVKFDSHQPVDKILSTKATHYISGFPIRVEPYTSASSSAYGDNIYVGRSNFERDEASSSHSDKSSFESDSNLNDNGWEYPSDEGSESSSSETREEDDVGVNFVKGRY